MSQFGLFVLLFQIEDMCRSTKALAVPVVPDSEGCLSLLIDTQIDIGLFEISGYCLGVSAPLNCCDGFFRSTLQMS